MSILLSAVGSLDNLRKDNLRHVASVGHEGKVVLVATTTDDAVKAKLLYTVRQDGYENSYLNTPADQRTGWEKWLELSLPDEDDAPGGGAGRCRVEIPGIPHAAVDAIKLQQREPVGARACLSVPPIH